MYEAIPEICLPKNILGVILNLQEPENACKILRAVLSKMEGEENAFDVLTKTERYLAEELRKTAERRAKAYLNRSSNFRENNPKAKKSIEN